MDFIPYLTAVAIIGGWFLGAKIRNWTATIIPFTEPVSYILVGVGVFIYTRFPSESLLALVITFFIGYLLGYIFIGEVDSEWIGVHDITQATQDIYEVVYYVDETGQKFAQPQRFRDVCKHIFFRVQWPLVLPTENIYRRRLVTMKPRYLPEIHAETVDILDCKREEIDVPRIRIGTYKLTKNGVNRYGDDSLIGQPKYLLHFKAYREIYNIAPYATDAPYDFIRKTNIYKKSLAQMSQAILKNIDADIRSELETRISGAICLSDLIKLTPDHIMMSPVKKKIEDALAEADADFGAAKYSDAEKQRLFEQQKRAAEADAASADGEGDA